ncbi:polynucleotide kinase [Serratia phage vB_SmaM-Otaku]|uniref:Polynucleotide kinase n=1 Tax=Serratia phage vB_SmaM-Otaku TaxID=2932867 RepID=A0AAE9KSX2_9CAUD|nr:polynucleotide kinase [Serratia phage vB_SmaM-Otaku]UPU16049.1 polynucleotide kinase [Serratia phage vB_SmaM-Otaku]
MTIKIAIIDLDGVMNSINDVRKHLVPVYTDRASYWAEWHKAHVKETINPAAIAHYQILKSAGYRVVFLSNRISTCLDTTAAQLHAAGVDPEDAILLRHPEDNRSSGDYKAGVVAHLLCGALYLNKADRVVVMIYDDLDTTLSAIETHPAVKEFKKQGVNIAAVHLATFTGGAK